MTWAESLELEGYKEGFAEGFREGREQGLKEGMIVGRVITLRELFDLPEMTTESLFALPLAELQKEVDDLNFRLRQQRSNGWPFTTQQQAQLS